MLSSCAAASRSPLARLQQDAGRGHAPAEDVCTHTPDLASPLVPPRPPPNLLPIRCSPRAPSSPTVVAQQACTAGQANHSSQMEDALGTTAHLPSADMSPITQRPPGASARRTLCMTSVGCAMSWIASLVIASCQRGCVEGWMGGRAGGRARKQGMQHLPDAGFARRDILSADVTLLEGGTLSLAASKTAETPLLPPTCQVRTLPPAHPLHRTWYSPRSLQHSSRPLLRNSQLVRPRRLASPRAML